MPPKLLVLCCFALPCLSQEAAYFTIAGQVIHHLDQHPVKGARVSISMLKNSEHQVSTISGINGEFSFQGVPAGKYQLRVTDHGATQLFQQSDNYSTAIVVGVGKDSEHIVFALDATAGISGTVLDEDNDPVPQAMVYVFVRSLVYGRYQTLPGARTNTATDGTFRFRHLHPGLYYVAVSGRPWYAQGMMRSPMSRAPEHSELNVAYPVTYYAGSASPEGATPIKLEEGTQAQLQIAVHAVPAVHIALDGNAQEDKRMMVSIAQTGPGGTILHLPIMYSNNELLGIAPGNYLISGVSGEPQAVTLASNTTVHLDEAIKTSVTGKVMLPADIPSGLAVSLQDTPAGRAFTAKVKTDGTFEVEHVTSGHYLVELLEASSTYLSKIDVRGGRYTNGELGVAKGAQVELLITAGTGTSALDGVATQDKKPISGATILLIPQDLTHGHSIARFQSDSDATFTFSSIAPGRYILVAIDNGRDLPYAEPGGLTPYLANGQPLTLPLANDAPVQVEVQTRQ